MKTILITGGAGFIGSSLTKKLLSEPGFRVVSIDNFDNSYDRSVKEHNLSSLAGNKKFSFIEGDVLHIDRYFQQRMDIDAIVHLAAKTGVRESVGNAVTYYQVNFTGTRIMLDFARSQGIRKFIFGSSGSVYGLNRHLPWKETESLSPTSPYACSKAAAEMLGHTYAHLYSMQFIALRFFTVYGPCQRPDLVIQKFLTAVLNDEPVPVFGDGDSQRDYTYIDDAVQGIMAALNYSASAFEIFNIAGQASVTLREVINDIGRVCNKDISVLRLPVRPEDVPATFADLTKARKLLNYIPRTAFYEGLLRQYQWLKAKQIEV